MSQKAKNKKNGIWVFDHPKADSNKINILASRGSHKNEMFQDLMLKVLILNDGKIEFKNKD